jgi:hypothetical protein
LKQINLRFALRLSLLQVLVAALILWFLFGNPMNFIAGLVYPRSPAPWEVIDLVFLPDRADPQRQMRVPDLHSLLECRTQAQQLAREQDDYAMKKAAWHCQALWPGWPGREPRVLLQPD